MEKNVRLILKAVRFTSRKKLSSVPLLHTSLDEVFEHVTTVAQTVYPPGDATGYIRRYFLNNWHRTKSGVWTFQVCSYVPGLTAKYMKPLDLNAATVPLADQSVEDADGNRLDLVSVFHVLAFGHVLIVEGRKGAGGANLLAHILSNLFHTHIGGDFPGLRCDNVVSANLRRQIQDGGGAVAVAMTIQEPIQESSTAMFGERINQLRKQFVGTKSVVLEWKAKKTFQTSQIESAYEEAREDDVEGFRIILANRESISLSSYRMGRVLPDFPVDDSGTPLTDHLIQEMNGYLIALMSAENGQPYLNMDGTLAGRIIRKGKR